MDRGERALLALLFFVLVGGVLGLIILLVVYLNQPTVYEMVLDYCNSGKNGTICREYTDWVDETVGANMVACVHVLERGTITYGYKGMIIYTPNMEAYLENIIVTCLTQYNVTVSDYLDTQ